MTTKTNIKSTSKTTTIQLLGEQVKVSIISDGTYVDLITKTDFHPNIDGIHTANGYRRINRQYVRHDSVMGYICYVTYARSYRPIHHMDGMTDLLDAHFEDTYRTITYGELRDMAYAAYARGHESHGDGTILAAYAIVSGWYDISDYDNGVTCIDNAIAAAEQFMGSTCAALRDAFAAEQQTETEQQTEATEEETMSATEQTMTETTEQATEYIVYYDLDGNGVTCTNIAIAESIEDVEHRYGTCQWKNIMPASESSVSTDDLKHRGCPVVVCEHIEPTDDVEQQDSIEATDQQIMGSQCDSPTDILDLLGMGWDEYDDATEDVRDAIRDIWDELVVFDVEGTCFRFNDDIDQDETNAIIARHANRIWDEQGNVLTDESDDDYDDELDDELDAKQEALLRYSRKPNTPMFDHDCSVEDVLDGMLGKDSDRIITCAYDQTETLRKYVVRCIDVWYAVASESGRVDKAGKASYALYSASDRHDWLVASYEDASYDEDCERDLVFVNTDRLSDYYIVTDNDSGDSVTCDMGNLRDTIVSVCHEHGRDINGSQWQALDDMMECILVDFSTYVYFGEPLNVNVSAMPSCARRYVSLLTDESAAA